MTSKVEMPTSSACLKCICVNFLKPVNLGMTSSSVDTNFKYNSISEVQYLCAVTLRMMLSPMDTAFKDDVIFEASYLQAVTLGMTSFKAMASVAKHYRGRFTTIVAFRPTGWSMPKGTSTAAASKAPRKAARGSRSQKGNLVSYQVTHVKRKINCRCL